MKCIFTHRSVDVRVRVIFFSMTQQKHLFHSLSLFRLRLHTQVYNGLVISHIMISLVKFCSHFAPMLLPVDGTESSMENIRSFEYNETVICHTESFQT